MRRLNTRPPCSLAIAFLLWVQACTTQAPEDAGATEPLLDLSPPLTQIGGANGEESHDLHRVFAGLMMHDGRILIGNSGSGEVRFYGQDGTIRGSSGRSGEGPGEFRAINGLATMEGDSVLVHDARIGRFSVLSPEGEFVRSFQTDFSAGPTRFVGRFSDGTLLLMSEGSYDPRQGPGTVRDSIQLILVDAAGVVLDSLGAYTGGEWLLYADGHRYGAVRLDLGRSTHVAVSGDRFVVGDSDSNELHVFDLHGRPVETLRVDGTARALTREEIDAAISENDGAAREALSRHFRNAQRGASAPIIAGLRGDRSGNVWVERFPGRVDSYSSWVVLASSGEIVRTLRLPRESLPLDADAERVLLRETNADGVQFVTLRAFRP